jgi:nucleotide-binding universal stress UspA family protein
VCPATLWLARREAAAPARVVVAVDPARPWPSDAVFSRQLLRTGLELARLYGAQCEALHVAPEPAPADAALDELAQACGIAAANRHALAGPVVEVLSGYVGDHDIGLLVIGGESRPGWQRVLLGNRTERISRRIGGDLVVLRPAADLLAANPGPLALPRAA